MQSHSSPFPSLTPFLWPLCHCPEQCGSLWRLSMDCLRESPARNPVYLVCLIWQQLDELFSGQRAGENSVEPGCKGMLAQAAVPSFREDSKEEWLMPAVTNTEKSMLKWNQDLGAVVLDRIWGSRMSCLWAPPWMEFGFTDHGDPPSFQKLSTFLFQEQIIFSKQSLYLSSVLLSSCQMEGNLLSVRVWVLDLCYLLLQSLQHSSRKFIGQYRNQNNKRTTLGFSQDWDEGIHLSTHYLCECHD